MSLQTKKGLIFACFSEQLTLVVEGSIVTGFFYKNFKLERGLANLTVPEFYDLYYQEESYRPELVGFEFICPMCYDSIWAIALALQCANNTLQDIGKDIRFELSSDYYQNERGHSVSYKIYVHPANTQISLRIRAV